MHIGPSMRGYSDVYSLRLALPSKTSLSLTVHQQNLHYEWSMAAVTLRPSLFVCHRFMFSGQQALIARQATITGKFFGHQPKSTLTEMWAQPCLMVGVKKNTPKLLNYHPKIVDLLFFSSFAEMFASNQGEMTHTILHGWLKIIDLPGAWGTGVVAPTAVAVLPTTPTTAATLTSCILGQKRSCNRCWSTSWRITRHKLNSKCRKGMQRVLFKEIISALFRYSTKRMLSPSMIYLGGGMRSWL